MKNSLLFLRWPATYCTGAAYCYECCHTTAVAYVLSGLICIRVLCDWLAPSYCLAVEEELLFDGCALVMKAVSRT